MLCKYFSLQTSSKHLLHVCLGEGDDGVGERGADVGAHDHGHGVLDGDDAAGHHGDDDGGAGGGALHQHREQHAHHQPHHRVGEEGVVVKYCA